MRPTSPNQQNRGFTLAEILVSMFLLMLLMGSLLAILQAGARYYTTSTKVVELQQSCLMAANQLGAELLEGNLNCVNNLAGGTTNNYNFVTFTSPRDDNGQVSFSSEKTLMWNQYVCFYVDPSKGSEVLRRQIVKIVPPKDQPPQVPGYLDANHFITLVPSATSPNAARIVAQNIYFVGIDRTTRISVIIGARDPYKEFRVSVQTEIVPRN